MNKPHKITDWDQKREALNTVLGVWTNEELVRSTLGPQATEDEVATIAGSLKSWNSHRPTGSSGKRFCQKLAEWFVNAGSRADIGHIKHVIVDGSYKEFCSLIPQDRRLGLVLTKPAAPPPPAADSIDDRFVAIYVLRHPPSQTLSTAFARRRIDQKFHYMTPDAAANWKGIVDSGVYKQYGDCHSALREVCESDLWRSFFTSDGGVGCVMLGCGAPSKDVLLINAMLGVASPDVSVQYTMVDFSSFMLKSSIHAVEAILRNQGNRSRVKLHQLESDFLDLTRRETVLLQGAGRPAVWLITGGTIGNLDEREFLTSMRRIVRPGDLFIMGAETISIEDQQVPVDQLRKKYDTPEVRRFVEAPLHSLWRETGRDMDELKSALRRIKIDVVDGLQQGHSAVPGAWSVEVSLDIDGVKLVLATSTRYDEAEFVAFAGKYRLELEWSVPSPLNARYKQMVFKVLD